MGDSCKHKSLSNKPYKKIRYKNANNEYDDIELWICKNCNKKYFYSDMYNEGEVIKIAPGMYALSLKPTVKKIKEKKKIEQSENVHCEIEKKEENEYLEEKSVSPCGRNVIRLIKMDLSWSIINRPEKHQIYSATSIKNTEVRLEVIYDKLLGKIYNLQIGKKIYDDMEWCLKLEKHILKGGIRNRTVIVNDLVDETQRKKKKGTNKKREQRLQKRVIANRNLEYENQSELDEQRRKKELAEIRRKEKELFLKMEEENRLKRLQHKQQYLETLPQIGMRTMLIRKNTFKCMHNQHHVENVDATIKIISKKSGKCYLEQIAAGYCVECGHYYILESTYNNLKNKGIIACRVCDEKSINKSISNGMILAQESILMQYGYNVSQTEGLSEKARRKILALLIDERILSKNDIISYLDFFVLQRQYQDKFQVAISKWESDAEFVREYRLGEYSRYGVNAVYR